MKRQCPFDDLSPKKMKVQSYGVKRGCPFDPPEAKRSRQTQDLKRKYEEEITMNKRQRVDIEQSYERLLAEAYARIHYLEAELKQAKILQNFHTSKSNLPYNHNIMCY